MAQKKTVIVFYSWQSDAPKKTNLNAIRVKAAILAVFSKNPKRPSELRGLSPDKLRHDQDVTNMKWLMSNVHVPTMDTHIEELPHRFTDRALFFSDALNGV